MKVLATFPGKFGDALWLLPSLRALSRRIGHPISLAVSPYLASIVPLLRQQAYLASVFVISEWTVLDTAPMTPRVPPKGWVEPYDLVLHLGYRSWPVRALPFETLDCLNETLIDRVLETPIDGLVVWRYTFDDEDLHLEKPWISVPGPLSSTPDVAVGFTDEHFELKYGIVRLLAQTARSFQSVGASPRWSQEGRTYSWSWEQSVQFLQNARVFLGCNSALHVLAVACGVPVVMVEPNQMRHHSIFYPLGQDGPQVTLVKGNDGLPTWDSRHTRDTIDQVLQRQGARR